MPNLAADENPIHMSALILVLVLFVLAILSPWIIPNDKVSDHKEDHV
jgi:hypothetical protein